ncbi:hypothetical protein FJ364_04135 [Candidatus Dependentiae bacterium]|nr:hypothetical protein [Candidatus Dependentiae bacterium]
MNTPNKQALIEILKNKIILEVLNEDRVRNSRTPSTDLYSHQSGAATRNVNNYTGRNENGESSDLQNDDIIGSRGSGGREDYSYETSSNSSQGMKSAPDSSTSKSLNPVGGDSFTTKLGTVALAKGAYDAARSSGLVSKLASKASQFKTNVVSELDGNLFTAGKNSTSVANRAGQATRIAAKNALSAAKDTATNIATKVGTAASTAISNPATIKTAAKTAASTGINVATGIGKHAAKAIPFAGAVATGLQAYDDLSKGKWGKALARGALGALGFIPGVGTVANIAGNIAIDAFWEHHDTSYYQNKLIEKLNDKRYSKYMLSE